MFLSHIQRAEYPEVCGWHLCPYSRNVMPSPEPKQMNWQVGLAHTGTSLETLFLFINVFLRSKWPEQYGGLCRMKHTLAVNQKGVVWSGIIRGFVSKINEAAGIANICQGDSNPEQLLESQDYSHVGQPC